MRQMNFGKDIFLFFSQNNEFAQNIVSELSTMAFSAGPPWQTVERLQILMI